MGIIKDALHEVVISGQQQEIDELKVHVDLLRVALSTINRILHDDCFAVGMPVKDYIELALSKYPDQSLNHIKAQVEEETIRRCYNSIRKSRPLWVNREKHIAYNCLAIGVLNMPRKYKGQSDD